MMDESQIIPGGSHFCRRWTRDGHSERVSWNNRCMVPSVNYYYIDFGFSALYNDPVTATSTDRRGQVQEAPELSKDGPYNPFKLDVYRLGFVFLQEAQVLYALRQTSRSESNYVLKAYPALYLFIPLCQKMILEDPELRLDASQSLSCFEEIVLGISPEQAIAPIRHNQEDRSVWRRETVPERIFQFIQSLLAPILF
jgi:hypothetical protein